MAKQQRELMARIQQQQRELDGMRKQREREEEQEKKEMERRRKREEERRRRMKEEEEQRLRDEAERRIREEEERERQQQNQYSHREDYSARNKPTRRFSPKSMYEDDMSSYKTQPTPPPPQTKPVRVQRKAVKPHPPPPQPPPPREQSPALPAPSNQDLSFFLAAANDPEAHASGRTNLVSCSNCGRKFASDRIQKHKAACGNVTKKRKVHDPSKMRVAGTDMENYYSSSKKQKPQPPPKKSNWRTKHESFIQTIRYAKKVSEMEKTGVSTSALPPPPPSDTSGLCTVPVVLTEVQSLHG
ncbi:hypothetical protein FSP39_008388 [Pinctada imbricata]|uniref:C2HC/C3H-type domain-containing protein n=1 Tax=Pinctada imbricata TaxID=66713 RepID=A0AA88Y2S1_PINIB|nr:hypothetical protein FSP39_008388 [Pinctada imbricata]